MSEESGALDAHGAADAFSSLLGGDAPNESEPQKAVSQPAEDESDEAAAERLAKQELSDDGDEQQDDGKQAESDELTIEVDGKSVKLTKAELAEYYKNGLRQSDYTRKTMEAAEARKTAEAESSKARQEREAYAHKLNHFAIATHSQLEQVAAQLAETDVEADPIEYLRLERTLREGQAKLGQAQQELQHITAQQQQEQAQAMQAHMTAQWEQLTAKLPEWKDPAKAKAESTAIREYLGSQGFESQERDFTDYRAILLARKAMQYDALISRAKETAKKVQALPTKVERSGNPETSRPDGRTTAMKQLERTGSVDAAANAFAQFIK